MDLQQDFFAYVLKWKKNNKIKALDLRKSAKCSIELDEIQDSLTCFASAVFAKPMEVRRTEGLPHVSGTKLFLPAFVALNDSHAGNYICYHLLVLHLWAISKHIAPINAAISEYENFALVNQHIPAATALLIETFPNYLSHYQAMGPSWNDEEARKITPVAKKFKLTQELGFDPRLMWGQLPRQTQNIDSSNSTPEQRTAFPEGVTEKKSKSKGEIKKISLDEKENLGQDVFTHFEKVETAEEYKGIQRDTDGSDEMNQHADALDDLNIEEVVRSNKTAKSLYKTELDMGFEIADFKEDLPARSWEEVFHYDEWDQKKRVYKKDWCRVVYSKQEATGENYRLKSLKMVIKERAVEIGKLKKKLIQLASEVKVVKKLFYGRGIDIDNVIRNVCRQKNGDSGDQRYYQETRKRHRDMVCLLLVDTSLSSDSWVQNKRVLDVCLEALLTFGEASSSLGDPVMVAGFNSNTRHDCKFLQWKSFEDPWSKFIDKVDEISPAGYTRIGPAIRHATHILSERKEKHKLLLIFTDGRPTDFDKYEGNYGLGDVRQAVREADRQGVVSFALAVDPSAKHFLPQLFGLGNFQILHNIQAMPEALSKLYGRMAKRS